MKTVTNITGWIQRGIRLGLLYNKSHVSDVFNYLKGIGFKNTNDNYMIVMHRMVRKKHVGYETIQSMRGFIANPNPNSN